MWGGGYSRIKPRVMSTFNKCCSELLSAGRFCSKKIHLEHMLYYWQNCTLSWLISLLILKNKQASKITTATKTYAFVLKNVKSESGWFPRTINMEILVSAKGAFVLQSTLSDQHFSLWFLLLSLYSLCHTFIFTKIVFWWVFVLFITKYSKSLQTEAIRWDKVQPTRNVRFLISQCGRQYHSVLIKLNKLSVQEHWCIKYF